MVEVHNKKMEEYITKLTAEYPHIKYSTEYLNGRLQENKLAKQERFIEASQKKTLNFPGIQISCGSHLITQ